MKEILISNAHTHTLFCDGRQSAEEMARAAYEKGFCALGFSGHSYTPFDTSFCMPKEQIPLYIKEIRRLKEKYKGKMAIFCGVEADAFCAQDLSPFDYIIAGAHYVCAPMDNHYYCIDNTAWELEQCIKKGFGNDVLAMLKAYFDTLENAVMNFQPQIIAHFDLIRKVNDNRFFDENGSEYLSLAYACMESCIKYCPLTELNTGGIYRGYTKTPYPALPLLKKWLELGGKIIITADAHNTDSLDFYFAECREILKAAGYQKHTLLTAAGFEEFAL